jgi:hypothetical protein
MGRLVARFGCAVANRLAIAVFAVALAGCAAWQRSDAALQAGVEDDVARALSALLPAHADECVVARPLRLERSLHAIFAPISQADTWLWLPGSIWSGYAHAVWKHSGKKRWLTLLNFSGDPAPARAWLTQHAGLALQWGDAAAYSCAAEGCPALARFLDAHTVELSRGAQVTTLAGSNSNSPCARLVRERPTAFEVSFRREEPLFSDVASDVPLQTSAWSQASAVGVRVQHEELMADSAAAQRAMERDACRELWGGGNAAVDATCERTRDDLLVHTTARMRWEELRLRSEDSQRHARAERYASALERVHSDDAVDWSNLEAAWQELSARRALLASSAADPHPLALELLHTLNTALALHPNEPRFMQLRAELERLGQVMTTADRPAMNAP